MDNTLKRLRLTHPGYEDYTGQVGKYAFVDGLSDELMSMAERDRIAAAMACDEIDEDGHRQPAGYAARVLREYETRSEVVVSVRQNAAEKRVEDIAALLNGLTIPVIRTRGELEEIASEGGIEKLREVAEPWDVRSRAILELIAKIEDAQDNYIADTVADLVAKGVPDAEARALFRPKPVETEAPSAEPVDPATPAHTAFGVLVDAAISGDLSAALNAQKE